MSTTPTVTKTSNKARILLVDDHPVLRRGVAELINGEAIYEVCGEVGTLAEAYASVNKLKPELVVVDISLDGNNGVELMKELTYRWPDLPLLAYSMHDEQIYAERALRAGAKGYVMKQHPPETLLEAIRSVLKGKVYLSPQMSDRMLGKLVGAGASDKPIQSPIEKLSDRELEVLQLIGKGQTTAQIADKLCLSVKTIETYREHLKQKLNLKSGPELVRYAIEWVAEPVVSRDESGFSRSGTAGERVTSTTSRSIYARVISRGTGASRGVHKVRGRSTGA